MHNHGQLQAQFEDGSVGRHEGGRGQMISEEAFCVDLSERWEDGINSLRGVLATDVSVRGGEAIKLI